MGKRGPKPKGKVKTEWSPEFAYAIGLITTDGNLSPNRRTINFTSKDKSLVLLFKKCLSIKSRVGKKARAAEKEKKYFVIQVGDVIFYHFLESIGLAARKSKTLGKLLIPDKYFFDFLRGHFDGDGCFYSYWDPRWRSSFMFYIELVSASQKHIIWVQKEITRLLSIKGRITKSKNNPCYRLKFAKAETILLLKKLYYKDSVTALKRKHLKIKRALATIGRSL